MQTTQPPTQPEQTPPPEAQARQELFANGFLAGLAAGILATGIMLLLNIEFHGVSLPEEMGSWITQLMPAPLFAFLHQLIGDDAKHVLVAIVVVGQCAVFGLAGGFFNQLSGHSSIAHPRPDGKSTTMRWSAGLLLAFLLWLFSGLLLLPLFGSGLFGANTTSGLSGSMWSMGVVGLVYGLLYVLLRNLFSVREQVAKEALGAQAARERSRQTRRDVLRSGGLVLGVGVMGYLAWRFISNGLGSAGTNVAHITQNFKRKIVPPPTPNYGTLQPAQNLSPELTSNDQFYTVSKNLVSDPTVDARGWHMEVKGQVRTPYTLNYDEILQMPTRQQYESLMCISNEVGGPYMGNALWEGFPLSTLLERAGVKEGATKVVLHAADDYSDSIHLSKALEPTTLVAVRMNGQTLPQQHGFPARLLVPGIYGMKHVKWITGIEVVNYDFQGYWQNRGWDDAAPVRMTTRIDTPLTGATLTAGRTSYIAGVAFSGNKGISQVDVSLDGGANWQRATLKKPFSQITWILWELSWTPKAGQYSVVARAIDLESNVQDPAIASPAPAGSSGYHTISITVR
ncbi:hypothetical protein KSC_076680 [Ktedonobacter sp. SOSP1-52]|uniref:molybdopterin-dependent oxidoreductase n=1 Tax=Ktedonobacter sp. SOSP1-52 TaxID=2778366 RepID=UPI0019160D44|nr:molybdopterin-dependent oxidoreductase [Ktedonobacter sp. SOSP1-52]GHO68776.1 hypothetical protein KSC_076680 [Ktedonobacter sp. SOSP1-52]